MWIRRRQASAIKEKARKKVSCKHWTSQKFLPNTNTCWRIFSVDFHMVYIFSFERPPLPLLRPTFCVWEIRNNQKEKDNHMGRWWQYSPNVNRKKICIEFFYSPLNPSLDERNVRGMILPILILNDWRRVSACPFETNWLRTFPLTAKNIYFIIIKRKKPFWLIIYFFFARWHY